MNFLDKAKKLAEQAAEKAEPLIDKAAPHARKVADKAGQQIDKRTGGKYHDRIEAVEAKVGEYADKRSARRGGTEQDEAQVWPDPSAPVTPPPVTPPPVTPPPTPPTPPTPPNRPTP